MPRGLPDYFNPDTLVSQRLANVEEVVTALQGIGSIDNRGRTLFFEAFNSTLVAWHKQLFGDGSLAILSTQYAYIPPATAFLDVGTVGGTGKSWILRRFHLDATALLGFESSILYTTLTPIYRVDILYNLGGDAFLARLEVLPNSGVVRVWVPDEWVTIGNVGYVAHASGPWLPIKLVADFENAMYVRALIGQVQVDLSAHSLSSGAELEPGEAEFRLECQAVNAVWNYGYIGHATGTVDEP